MSVIDLSTNSVIGEPLKSWDAWPGTDTSADRDDSESRLIAHASELYELISNTTQSTLTLPYLTTWQRYVMQGVYVLSSGFGT